MSHKSREELLRSLSNRITLHQNISMSRASRQAIYAHFVLEKVQRRTHFSLLRPAPKHQQELFVDEIYNFLISSCPFRFLIFIQQKRSERVSEVETTSSRRNANSSTDLARPDRIGSDRGEGRKSFSAEKCARPLRRRSFYGDFVFVLIRKGPRARVRWPVEASETRSLIDKTNNFPSPGRPLRSDL